MPIVHKIVKSSKPCKNIKGLKKNKTMQATLSSEIFWPICHAYEYSARAAGRTCVCVCVLGAGFDVACVFVCLGLVVVCCCVVRCGVVWRGVAWCGVVWYGSVCLCLALVLARVFACVNLRACLRVCVCVCVYVCV